MKITEKKSLLREWAVSHGYTKSPRSNSIYSKVVKCVNGDETSVRLVFRNKVLRFEKMYFVNYKDYKGEDVSEKHWMMIRSGYYGNIEISKDGKLSGMSRGF